MTSHASPPSTANLSSQKRKMSPNSTAAKSVKKVKRVGPREDNVISSRGNGEKDGEEASKPKRVRTGCLTCRERHLKCDEATPHCNNCKRSNRTCRRGIRLNFIDLWLDKPPKIVTMYGTPEWKVEFLDESREIANEYQGGAQRYKDLDQGTQPSTAALESAQSFDCSQDAAHPPQNSYPMPPVQGMLSEFYKATNPQANPNPFETPQKGSNRQFQQQIACPQSASTQHSQFTDSAMRDGHGGMDGYNALDTDSLDQVIPPKDHLDNPEETLLMQVFVEEVGLWMDSMDASKHFSRQLPFSSLSEPMLLNAFLACGARHLTLVNPSYKEEKALHYYDTATRYLLKNLQNPNRNTVVCATTAVILNVYEIMSERALQRMNHIAGARALIKECGWNARTRGVGSACFWLNVGLEVLSCLHFNWQVAWDPDDWHVDMDLARDFQGGREELWTHRMLYIIAKICNFRATMARSSESNEQDEQIRKQQRHQEWLRLKSMCDAWSDSIPQTMRPMAYVPPHQTSSNSAFPEVWLVKRSTIVGRLFYHTAMLLMAQIHPYWPVTNNIEMANMQNQHSRTICGIVAHAKDRGVASVAIRSLAHAAEVLTDRKEQEEVIEVLGRINKETGWRIGFLYQELKERWGWREGPSPQQLAQTHTAHWEAQEAKQAQHRQHEHVRRTSLQHQLGFDLSQQQSPGTMLQERTPTQSTSSPLSQPNQRQPKKKPPPGISNPLYAKADFNLPQHPYQNFYVAPNMADVGQVNHNGFTPWVTGTL